MARKRALAKVTAKAEAAKAEMHEAAQEVKAAVEEKKEEVEAAAEEKKEEKTAKKQGRKPAKKEIKEKTYDQYFGKEVEQKEMIAAVKKDWTKASGKKVGDIKEINLYVKPEEAAVYYVVNGTDSGKVAF